ncbi:MAG: hypothetical protein CL608_18040 [Anaerolineaceae bacterium]|nr:hypothetical protein [Anaerolineaceae bacterium]
MFFLELLVFLLIMYFGIRPIYAAFIFARPPRLRVSYFTPTNLGVTYEDITLTSQDGTKLVGWYIPSRNKAAVILLHGHSGNRLGVLHQAEALVQAGYGVLMFDLRAHGSSGGRRFTRSQVGVDDVLTAVSYLSKRPEVNAAGIGVMGVSVGGLFALQAAAKTVAIRAVAADGPSPATLDDVPFPNSLLGRLNLWQERFFRRAVQWFGAHEPLPANREIVTKLKDRPLLLIATGEGVEAEMAQRLADEVETAVFWQIPEARHAQGWHERPEEYNHRLIAFFDGALARDDKTRISLPPLPDEAQETAVPSKADAAVPIEYEATVPMLQANLMAFVMLPLAFLLFWLPYRLAWQAWPFAAFIDTSFAGVLTLVLVLALSLIGHELLHAVGFWLIGGAPLNRIKFGFSWQGFAPYAHCREPLQTTAYRISVVLPGLFLGVIPGLLAVALRQPLLLMWATLMLLAAGGDAAVLWAVRKVPSTVRVLDHPKKVGCQVLAE